MMKAAILSLVVLSISTAACSDDSATAPATSTATGSAQTFSGIVPVQGSSFYSFSVAETSTVKVTLASLMMHSTGPASPAVVRLGVGVPSGTGCALGTSVVDTSAALTAQITASLAVPDVYCVQISDIGNLMAPMNFIILIALS
jgi:hypothetical protein